MQTDIHPIMTQVEANVDTANFYYVRDENKQMVGVVFVGQRGDTFARGVSILSVDEKGFDKSEGIVLAARRMIRAFKKKNCSDFINYGQVVGEEGDPPPHVSVVEFAKICDQSIIDDSYKSCYNANLSEFEKKVSDRPS